VSNIRFGLLGAASIAERAILPALQAVDGLDATHLASRSSVRSVQLRERFGVRTSDSYEAVLADPEVDAVYIGLPNVAHEEWSLRALRAGKHVYCEKPAALTLAGAERIAALARETGLVFFDGFMFLYHPQHLAVRDLLHAGAIGEPLHVDTWFGFPRPADGNHRLQQSQGGGALNDAAGYTLHATRFLLETEPIVASARLFGDPRSDVDERGLLTLDIPGDRTAQAIFGFGLGYRNAYAVWGREGSLTLERAFSVPPDHTPLVLLRDHFGREEARSLAPANQFAAVLEAVRDAVNGKRSYELFLDDFLAVSRLLQQARVMASQPASTGRPAR
jgi:dTDP-3,4-didehydro-2,6-dideoxy-alpha-D-glucose 3-reductase